MRARRIRSIFITSCGAFTTAQSFLTSSDPRRTSSARWADGWLGDSTSAPISRSPMQWVARSLRPGWKTGHSSSAPRAASMHTRGALRPTPSTTPRKRPGFPANASSSSRTRTRARQARSSAGRSGLPEHHNAVDNVRALINLALLTGHVGRYGSGVCPLRGQNNVQGGGDMGALPDKYPGGQAVADHESRAKFERAWNAALAAAARMESANRHVRGNRTRRVGHALRDRRKPGPIRGRSAPGATHCCEACAVSSCRTFFLTKTGEMADVVFPAASSWWWKAKEP